MSRKKTRVTEEWTNEVLMGIITDGKLQITTETEETRMKTDVVAESTDDKTQGDTGTGEG